MPPAVAGRCVRGCLIPKLQGRSRRKVERPPHCCLSCCRSRRASESISSCLLSLFPSFHRIRSLLPSVAFFRKLRQNKSYILLLFLLRQPTPFLLPTDSDCRLNAFASSFYVVVFNVPASSAHCNGNAVPNGHEIKMQVRLSSPYICIPRSLKLG